MNDVPNGELDDLVALRTRNVRNLQHLCRHVSRRRVVADVLLDLRRQRVVEADSVAQGASLAMGSFVEAEIEGREVAGLVKLPRAALAGEGYVVVVGKGDMLESRAVRVYRADDEQVWIAGGLAAGERVCAHAPSALAPGTRVRVAAFTPELAAP